MVFPPLAVVMCVTMLSVTWQMKLTVGRFLYMTRELRLYKFEAIIEQECMGAATLMKLRQSTALIVTCSCWFYAVFLFDTLGNAQGWNRTYWVLIALPLLPLCLMITYAVHRHMRGELFIDSSNDTIERAIELKTQDVSDCIVEMSGHVKQQYVEEAIAAAVSVDNTTSAIDFVQCTTNVLHV